MAPLQAPLLGFPHCHSRLSTLPLRRNKTLANSAAQRSMCSPPSEWSSSAPSHLLLTFFPCLSSSLSASCCFPARLPRAPQPPLARPRENVQLLAIKFLLSPERQRPLLWRHLINDQLDVVCVAVMWCATADAPPPVGVLCLVSVLRLNLSLLMILLAPSAAGWRDAMHGMVVLADAACTRRGAAAAPPSAAGCGCDGVGAGPSARGCGGGGAGNGGAVYRSRLRTLEFLIRMPSMRLEASTGCIPTLEGLETRAGECMRSGPCGGGGGGDQECRLVGFSVAPGSVMMSGSMVRGGRS
eukprot:364103-Chlamydomonas_euryale.AAC.5